MSLGLWRKDGATWRGVEPCGHWMPLSLAPCARRKGHGYEHRTREALDTQAGLEPLPRVDRLVADYPGVSIILGPVPCRNCNHLVVYGYSANALRDRVGACWRGKTGRRHVCPTLPQHPHERVEKNDWAAA